MWDCLSASLRTGFGPRCALLAGEGESEGIPAVRSQTREQRGYKLSAVSDLGGSDALNGVRGYRGSRSGPAVLTRGSDRGRVKTWAWSVLRGSGEGAGPSSHNPGLHSAPGGPTRETPDDHQNQI